MKATISLPEPVPEQKTCEQLAVGEAVKIDDATCILCIDTGCYLRFSKGNIKRVAMFSSNRYPLVPPGTNFIITVE